MNPVNDAVLKDLAPTGTLRAAINYGNGVLAQRGAERSGRPRACPPISPASSRKRLGVPLTFVGFDAAGQVFDALGKQGRTIRRPGTSPSSPSSRCAPPKIAFTAPYVLIEGTYLVRKDLPLKDHRRSSTAPASASRSDQIGL